MKISKFIIKIGAMIEATAKKSLDFLYSRCYTKSIERCGHMASIFDVAKYILEQQGEMSTMKLQKLCYYSQAWSLVWDDQALFIEEFHAWTNGPVCKELFYETQGKFSVTVSDEPGDSDNLTAIQKETIDAVLKHYASHDAQWLSRLTHMEDPWKQAREGIAPGLPCDNIISKESMGMYYGSL